MPRAMILAAGLGTRLRPLTLERPKPLVPLGDSTPLERAALALRRVVDGPVVVNAHHLAPLLHGVAVELGLTVVDEPVLRGTAGGVAGARPALLADARPDAGGTPGPAPATPVLLWNGDILIAQPPLAALLGAAHEGLVLAVVPRPRGEGTVGVGAGGRVVRLRGRCFGEELEGGDYFGLAALGARCLAGLPERGCLVGDWAIPELERGGPVTALVADVAFTDVGDPAASLAANLAWLEAGAPPVAEPRGELVQGSWWGRGGAGAPGVTLERCVVGQGARVTGQGALARVVVWPGATAVAPLRDAIVTPRAVVRVG